VSTEIRSSVTFLDGVYLPIPVLYASERQAAAMVAQRVTRMSGNEAFFSRAGTS